MRNEGGILRGLATLNVVVLLLVVVAGAVVRATGSGMGCPDWPKCFDRLIPPTDVSQIPPRFMAQFLTEGHGNLVHTWVEYINRLLGALSGFVGLATCAVAARVKQWRTLAILVVGLIAFGFVAWLGKVVVDTSLAPHKVSIHMLGGMFLVSTAVVARALVSPRPPAVASPSLRGHLWLAVLAIALQIVLGTQVREAVDALNPGDCCNGRLESALGTPFAWHRLSAWLAVGVVGSLAIRLWRQQPRALASIMMLALLGASYLTGVLLYHLGLPAWLQPAHLILATVLLATVLDTAIRFSRSR
jgi:heme a synthase